MKVKQTRRCVKNAWILDFLRVRNQKEFNKLCKKVDKQSNEIDNWVKKHPFTNSES